MMYVLGQQVCLFIVNWKRKQKKKKPKQNKNPEAKLHESVAISLYAEIIIV